MAMGMFDNFLKVIDNTLKDVESGKLEERLNKFADSIDKTSAQAVKATEKLADKPTDLLKMAEQKKTEFEKKAADVKRHVGKNIGIIQNK